MDVKPTQTKEVLIAEITFDKTIAPRRKLDPRVVKRYSEALAEGAELPPIKVDQNNQLLDGRHRLTAFRDSERKTIPAQVITCASLAEAHAVAVEENSCHGLPLDSSEIYDAAVTMFKNGYGVEEIARRLGVARSSVYNWTERVRAKEKEERDTEIRKLAAKGLSQREIADEAGVTKSTVARLSQNSNGGKMGHPEPDGDGENDSTAVPLFGDGANAEEEAPSGEEEAPEQTAIVTIGYSGHSIESFIERLKAAGVSHLWDIRASNSSQFTPAFSGGNLSHALAEVGIEYEHKKQLREGKPGRGEKSRGPPGTAPVATKGAV